MPLPFEVYRLVAEVVNILMFDCDHRAIVCIRVTVCSYRYLGDGSITIIFPRLLNCEVDFHTLPGLLSR